MVRIIAAFAAVGAGTGFGATWPVIIGGRFGGFVLGFGAPTKSVMGAMSAMIDVPLENTVPRSHCHGDSLMSGLVFRAMRVNQAAIAAWMLDDAEIAWIYAGWEERCGRVRKPGEINQNDNPTSSARSAYRRALYGRIRRTLSV